MSLELRQFKAEIFQALGHPTRIAIVEMLCKRRVAGRKAHRGTRPRTGQRVAAFRRAAQQTDRRLAGRKATRCTTPCATRF